MPGRPLRAAVEGARRILVGAAAASPPLRRALARTGRELGRAALVGDVVAEARQASGKGPSLYAGSYFGVGRDPGGDRQGRSGYARYDRVASNADIAAWLLWRNFAARRTLDVGCATGYLVEALRELGVDAHGSDVSGFAVEHAVPGALGYVRYGDPVRGLPYAEGEFELVSALEVLEHLDPAVVDAALAELRRVCGGYLYATIPSFGANGSGPHGHFDGKVRPERLAHYRALGDGYLGPVPTEDLAVDEDGHLVEGHLTIAAFGWWIGRFEAAGFVHRPDLEARLYEDIYPARLAEYWNLYVFAVPGAPAWLAARRSPDRTLAELGLSHPLIEHHAAERHDVAAPGPGEGGAPATGR